MNMLEYPIYRHLIQFSNMVEESNSNQKGGVNIGGTHAGSFEEGKGNLDGAAN